MLLSALVNKEVCTRESLLKAWKEDPKCEGFFGDGNDAKLIALG